MLEYHPVTGDVRRDAPGASAPAVGPSTWPRRTGTGRSAARERPVQRDIRRRPGRLVVTGFAGAVVVGTLLLLLPVSSAGRPATVIEALFTATSAVCVTGLVVVDTGSHWSGFGQAVILGLIQVGGFGIMTVASLLGLVIARRLGLQSRLVAAAATRSVGLGDVRAVLLNVLRITVLIETTTAVVLTVRFATTYDEPLPRAVWLGLFHSISAFNNAGFGLWPDNLTRYATDPWVNLPVIAAVLIGGIGFPVLFELRRHRRWSRWSLHTRITLLMSAVLVVVGPLLVLAGEWSNPRTLGALDGPGRILAAFFQGIMPRTAGFNTIDTGEMTSGTWLATDVLMFIGGGSGGTAGGIKMTTFAVLLVVIWSELRGDPDVTFFDRRIPTPVQRQALSVALLSVAAVIVPTLVITMTSQLPEDEVLFEVVSAFATVGLSTGITADLHPAHQLLLIVLMFAGRLGPVALGTAMALRERQRLYRRPEGAPIVG
ncbi:TrkH family potassium uptake protein [Actinotalea sp. Marseille-Q4924]|uniref:TrkH family potassium uptake protein n=1 Tax=Actinotalea sp. Marseille-Q4924 TaxID=2866571 RepID=UPI001CE4B36C|nr:TrkH family potassium uptake protein [Actinotalea sp. Marseille-Q4924]